MVYNLNTNKRGTILKKSLFPIAFIGIIFFIFLYLSGRTPQKDLLYNIAVLNYTPAAGPALVGLKTGLSEKGLYTGIDVNYIYNGPQEGNNLLRKEAERLITMKPDLIYTMSAAAAKIAAELTKDSKIPIVFGPVSSPMQTKLITSLKNLNDNITGVTFGPQEGRRLEMFTKIAPNIKKILIPYSSKDNSPTDSIKVLEPMAENLGLELILLNITDYTKAAEVFSKLEINFDAILTPTDSAMAAINKLVADYAIKNKIPFSCPHKEGVAEGALFSYGFSIEELGKQASRLVYMIYNGTPANEIPIELSEFTLSLNMHTARAIGLVVPKYLSNSAILLGDNNVY